MRLELLKNKLTYFLLADDADLPSAAGAAGVRFFKDERDGREYDLFGCEYSISTHYTRLSAPGSDPNKDAASNCCRQADRFADYPQWEIYDATGRSAGPSMNTRDAIRFVRFGTLE